MKTFRILAASVLLTSTLLVVHSCNKDDDSSPNVYFTAKVRLNSTPPETYESSSYTFEGRIDSTLNDTLIFEGCRDGDDSYMYFNLIRDDVYSFAAGDTISIPYDAGTGTEVFCSLLVNSLSTTIFQPYFGSEQGQVIIEEIDYEAKKLKGKFFCTLYSGSDTLTVTDGEFLIDE